MEITLGGRPQSCLLAGWAPPFRYPEASGQPVSRWIQFAMSSTREVVSSWSCGQSESYTHALVSGYGAYPCTPTVPLVTLLTCT
jgi:hypothetical protein